MVAVVSVAVVEVEAAAVVVVVSVVAVFVVVSVRVQAASRITTAAKQNFLTLSPFGTRMVTEAEGAFYGLTTVMAGPVWTLI